MASRVVDKLDVVRVNSDEFSGIHQSVNSERPADIQSPSYMENIPHEPHTKGKKKMGGICGFFRRTLKAIKRPFRHMGRTRVEPIVPPLRPDTQASDTDLTPVYGEKPGIKRTFSTGTFIIGPASPDQTPESLDTKDMMPTTSRAPYGGIHERDDDLANFNSCEFLEMADSLPVQRPSALEEDIERVEEEKERPETQTIKKKSGITGFFQRTRKAVKSPFRRHRKIQPVEPSDPKQTSDPCASGIEHRPDEDQKMSSSCEPVSDQKPEPEYQLCFEPTNGDVTYYYHMGHLLGSGGFGTVYKSMRRSDGKMVAIKAISKHKYKHHLLIPGHSEPLSTEVALMLMMSKPPISPNVVKMFEWFDCPSTIHIVMEYSHHTIPLDIYMKSNSSIHESIASVLMSQAVLALYDCITHGVYHSDVHPGNFLINVKTFELKLIDFGCGYLVNEEGFTLHQYRGVRDYCPPEILRRTKFYAVPANVWQLGLLLGEMVNGFLPYDIKRFKYLNMNPNISKECLDVIIHCLHPNPDERPTLLEILYYDWFDLK